MKFFAEVRIEGKKLEVLWKFLNNLTVFLKLIIIKNKNFEILLAVKKN